MRACVRACVPAHACLKRVRVGILDEKDWLRPPALLCACGHARTVMCTHANTHAHARLCQCACVFVHVLPRVLVRGYMSRCRCAWVRARVYAEGHARSRARAHSRTHARNDRRTVETLRTSSKGHARPPKRDERPADVYTYDGECACVRVHACVCAREWVRACVHVCTLHGVPPLVTSTGSPQTCVCACVRAHPCGCPHCMYLCIRAHTQTPTHANKTRKCARTTAHAHAVGCACAWYLAAIITQCVVALRRERQLPRPVLVPAEVRACARVGARVGAGGRTVQRGCCGSLSRFGRCRDPASK
jgi:hypothetical protein